MMWLMPHDWRGRSISPNAARASGPGAAYSILEIIDVRASITHCIEQCRTC
jgi:hypothetical protein